MRDYEGLAAIMAQQRSGTHMLGSAVGSHPDVKYTGELFCRRVPQSEERMWQLIDQVHCGGFAVVCLDVKYNQISLPVERLLENIPVIHLIRRDLDRLYYSGELHDLYNCDPEAKAAGVQPLFEIEEERYRSIAEAQQRWIRRYGHLESLRVYYEDLTGNREIEQIPEAAGMLICDTLGVGYHPLMVLTRKSAPADVDGLLCE